MKRIVPSSMYGDYPAQLTHLTRILPNGCWEFTGYIHPNGYGQLGRNVGAHRIAWEVANGRPVPSGLVVDHTCHNAVPDCLDNQDCPHRRCVNPAHLEAVTSATNIMRGHGFGPANDAKTHCDHGHEFTPDNIYYRPDRYGRICRTCRDETLRAGRHKWAEAKRLYSAARYREEHAEGYAIREWAMANGLPCKMRGPISRAVRAAYAAAQSGERAARLPSASMAWR